MRMPKSHPRYLLGDPVAFRSCVLSTLDGTGEIARRCWVPTRATFGRQSARGPIIGFCFGCPALMCAFTVAVAYIGVMFSKVQCLDLCRACSAPR
jgi:hypothetical protein